MILAESGPWLLAGFLLAGLAHAWIPMSWVRRQLGGGGVWSVVKASAIGVPMPLCSCSVIPAASALRRQGASRGATAAFAISTPEDGSETIALTWGLLGPVMAIVRPIAAVISALSAGILIDASGREREEAASARAALDEPAASACGCAPKEEEGASSCCSASIGDAPRAGVGARMRSAMRYALVEMPMDLSGWLLAGLALSALIGASVPAGWIESRIGEGLGAMLLMLVVGLPIYVCAAASTPVAAALVAKGLSPGAALVFLLAGPATNMATMAWALKDLGARALGIYLASIAVVAVGMGVAIDAAGVEIPAGILPGAQEHAHHPAAIAAGAALGALLVVGGVRRGVGVVRRRVGEKRLLAPLAAE